MPKTMVVVAPGNGVTGTSVPANAEDAASKVRPATPAIIEDLRMSIYPTFGIVQPSTGEGPVPPWQCFEGRLVLASRKSFFRSKRLLRSLRTDSGDGADRIEQALGGEDHGDRRPAARLAGELQAATVQFHELLGERQAKSGTFVAPR